MSGIIRSVTNLPHQCQCYHLARCDEIVVLTAIMRLLLCVLITCYCRHYHNIVISYILLGHSGKVDRLFGQSSQLALVDGTSNVIPSQGTETP